MPSWLGSALTQGAMRHAGLCRQATGQHGSGPHARHTPSAARDCEAWPAAAPPDFLGVMCLFKSALKIQLLQVKSQQANVF